MDTDSFGKIIKATGLVLGLAMTVVNATGEVISTISELVENN